MSTDIEIDTVILDPATMNNWRVGDDGYVTRGADVGRQCTIAEYNVGGPPHGYNYQSWAYTHSYCEEFSNAFSIMEGDIKTFTQITREDTLRIYFKHGEEPKYLEDDWGTLSLTTDSEIFVYMPERPEEPGRISISKNFFSLFPALVSGADDGDWIGGCNPNDVGVNVGFCPNLPYETRESNPPNGLLMPYTKLTCAIPFAHVGSSNPTMQPCVLMSERVTSETGFSPVCSSARDCSWGTPDVRYSGSKDAIRMVVFG